MENILEVFNVKDEYVLNQKYLKSFFYENENLKQYQKNLIKKSHRLYNSSSYVKTKYYQYTRIWRQNIQYLEIAILEINLIKKRQGRTNIRNNK